jgi:hypothetical protein
MPSNEARQRRWEHSARMTVFTRAKINTGASAP